MDVIFRTIQKEAAACEGKQCATILYGDITDSGASKEWETLSSIWQNVEFALRTIAVPGNHDFQLTLEHQGSSIVTRPVTDAQRQERAKRLSFAFAELGWPSSFPELHDYGWAQILTVDSVRYRNGWLLSNAIGFFGEDQLEQIRLKLEQAQYKPLLVVTHHHPGRHEEFPSSIRDIYGRSRWKTTARFVATVVSEDASAYGSYSWSSSRVCTFDI